MKVEGPEQAGEEDEKEVEEEAEVTKKEGDKKGEAWEKEEKSWTRFLGFSSPNLTTNCSRWAREQLARRGENFSFFNVITNRMCCTYVSRKCFYMLIILLSVIFNYFSIQFTLIPKYLIKWVC